MCRKLPWRILMPSEKPRLGPWLRHYGERREPTLRERLPEMLLGLGAALLFFVVLAGILWSFVRFPFETLGGLVAVWVVGLVVLLIKRRRDQARRRTGPGAGPLTGLGRK
ncbi:MAG: hypothetical protein GTN78_16355 [Gemmatimonadales bacterium]|nr:hypothetical protein [Gemmatimonadales bacterium]